MRTAKELRAYIFGLAGEFDRYFEERKYHHAKYAYDTARTLAVAMQLPTEDMVRLFGEHDEKGEQRDGALFKEYKVQKAYYEAGVRKRTCRMVPVMENQTQKNRA